MINLRLTILISFIIGFLLNLGCELATDVESLDANSSREKISIVTTTTQVTDLVKRLVGNFCDIKPLMGPGVDPHSYKPTALDITAISTADMVIYHGLQLEGKLATILSNGKDRGIKIFAVSSRLPKQMLLASDEDTSEYPDPHIWFAPKLWSQCLRDLSEYLIKELPNLRNQIIERRVLIENEIDAITEWAQAELNSIPEDKRILITSHDAFRYLGESFGIKVIALQGISTLQEAGLLDRSNLVDFIKKNRVGCLFIESSVNPKAIEEIAKQTGASIGAPLYSDALGPSEEKSIGPNQKAYPHDSWEGMMIYNVSSISRGLNP